MGKQNSRGRFVSKDYAGAIVGQMLLLSDSLGDLEHNVTKGTLKELLVSGLLKPFLPVQFATTSGIIVNVDGTQSGQTDIVIVDRRILPPFFYSQNVGIIPVESVVATIEVKSTLSLSEIKKANGAARRLIQDIWSRHLLRQGKVQSAIKLPLACVFGFTGPKGGKLAGCDETAAAAWLEQSASHLIAVVQARRYSWMLVNKKWSRAEDDASSGHEGVKRFVGVLIDNCRRIAETNFQKLAGRHLDIVGRYIRTQSIDQPSG